LPLNHTKGHEQRQRKGIFSRQGAKGKITYKLIEFKNEKNYMATKSHERTLN